MTFKRPNRRKFGPSTSNLLPSKSSASNIESVNNDISIHSGISSSGATLQTNSYNACDNDNISESNAPSLISSNTRSLLREKIEKPSVKEINWIPIQTPSFASHMLIEDIFYHGKKDSQNICRRKRKRTKQDIFVPNDAMRNANSSESKLREVPISFRSSQDYADVFLPLIVEEGLEEVRANVRSGMAQKKMIPWSCNTIVQNSTADLGGIRKNVNFVGSRNGIKGTSSRMKNMASKLPSCTGPVDQSGFFLFNEVQTTKKPETILLDFVLQTHQCRTFEEVLRHETKFYNDRFIAGRNAEQESAVDFGFKHPFISPKSLKTGDLLLLVPSRDFWSESEKYSNSANIENSEGNDIENIYWLSLVQSSGSFEFNRVDNPKSFRFEIVVKLVVSVMNAKSLPKRTIVYKLASCITSLREYEAVSNAVSASSSSQYLLNVLLNGKETYKQENEHAFPEWENLKLKISAINGEKKLVDLSRFARKEAKKLSICIPGTNKYIYGWLSNEFNPSQREAILKSATNVKGFTLIQGPPGTGKTHTLYGIINMLHLSIFQRYYKAIVPVPDPTKPKVRSGLSTPSDSFGRGGGFIAKKKPHLRVDLMPHILITAPSNNAVDVIVSKVLKMGFLDNSGNHYMPNIVRLKSNRGNEVACTGAGTRNSLDGISVDRQAVQLLEKLRPSKGNEGQLFERISNLELREKQILNDMASLRTRCQSLATQAREFIVVSAECNNTTNANLGHQIENTENQTLRKELLQKSMKEFYQVTAIFLKAREKLEKTRLELSRCRIVAKNRNESKILSKLEGSVLEQAHIVFSTLSSSGLKQVMDFGERFKFEVVVVDEAGQATETSVLVPLCHRVERFVLVGDPKQLPATVLSDCAQRNFFQQSLFERLQRAGHETYMLDEQYRSHPLISAFPAKFFYGGKLRDGKNVTSPDYIVPFLDPPKAFSCPLTFFNVSMGREFRGAQSYINEMEANLAVNIYLFIRKVLKLKISKNSTARIGANDSLRSQRDAIAGDTANDSPFVPITSMYKTTADIGVGIITPYRDQLDLIKSRFREMNLLGDPMLQLDTVDGFQGRELDIIIFSCVRSNSKNDKDGKISHPVVYSDDVAEDLDTLGNTTDDQKRLKRPNIGFLNDARRLNVAITRAKYMLLVLGQEKSLSASRLWNKFIHHVRCTGQVIDATSDKVELLK